MAAQQLINSLILVPATSVVNAALFIAQATLYHRLPSSPAQRTSTTHLTTFTRPAPSAVTYDVSQPNSVTVTVPPQSTWTSGPHWHERHLEYLQVVTGLARVTLDGETRVYGPSDGVVEVPRYAVHEWRREARGYARVDGEERKDLVVREWTVPADGQKETFFRMLNSYLTEAEPQRLHRWLPLPHFVVVWLEQRVVLLQLLVIFRAGDNWPVFGKEVARRLGWRTWAVAHAYLRIAWMVGWLLGLKGRYEEYVGRASSAGERNTHIQPSKKPGKQRTE